MLTGCKRVKQSYDDDADDNDDDDDEADLDLPKVHVKPSTKKFYQRHHQEVSISHLIYSAL